MYVVDFFGFSFLLFEVCMVIKVMVFCMGLSICCKDVVLFCVKNIVGVLNEVEIEFLNDKVLEVWYEIVSFGFIVLFILLL